MQGHYPQRPENQFRDRLRSALGDLAMVLADHTNQTDALREVRLTQRAYKDVAYALERAAAIDNNFVYDANCSSPGVFHFMGVRFVIAEDR